ncbi:acyltransferase [Mucilaginibacter sp. Bleaf8]|uniref:acyltransferase n=1 Tax=Mucilaginibacter sp. Bleaf8 TaxID=2834430 RepID=UPI001BCEF2FC|nr:acyltransferase [Mucilaginibacter sp. Bleaf8]MBS7566457.1 acyltransferase [Mucilaginibacter sp. Bleaf8]
MAKFQYLWKNRVRFKVFSEPYFKAWAKRLLLLPEVIKRNSFRKKLIRNGALISETAEIGDVNVSGKLSLLNVGCFSFIGKVNIALHDKVQIGEKVCINDGVEILTASHDVLDPEWKHTKGKIIIEDYAWIGTGATILPGVTIGRGAVVGAKAVVSKSVAKGSIVVGNPAKALSKSRPEELTYNPCEFLAANNAWLVG